MAPQVVKRLPEGDDWTYELKFDGYRALILKDHDRVEVRSRKNKDLTRMYPRVAAAGLKLNADQAVVDGEIVALDLKGRPSFQALQHRGTQPEHQIVYYAFDLLHLDGTCLWRIPDLSHRSQRVPSLVTLVLIGTMARCATWPSFSSISSPRSPDSLDVAALVPLSPSRFCSNISC
jgi:ATP-dependent DNA ligase